MAVFNLTGSGVQALSAGVSRLIVDVTAFPLGPGAGRASPTNYYDVGLLRQGVGSSYGPALPVDSSSMFLDLAAGVTNLGYSLFGTTSIRVTEQFSGPVGNPTRINQANAIAMAANASNVTVLSYTVPANRRARLDQVYIAVQGGFTDPTQTNVAAGGHNIGSVYSAGGTHTGEMVSFNLPSPLLLFAGEQLQIYSSNSTTGNASASGAILGVEFDAATWVPS